MDTLADNLIHTKINKNMKKADDPTFTSFLACVKSETFAFLVTLRPLGSMRRGETMLHTL